MEHFIGPVKLVSNICSIGISHGFFWKNRMYNVATSRFMGLCDYIDGICNKLTLITDEESRHPGVNLCSDIVYGNDAFMYGCLRPQPTAP